MAPLTHFEKAVEDAVKGGYQWQGGDIESFFKGLANEKV